METQVKSQNKNYGFYGTMKMTGHAKKFWNMAIAEISKAVNEYPSYIQPFLDSPSGRQFAETVISNLDTGCSPLQAIKRAINTWLTWKHPYMNNEGNYWIIPLLEYQVHHTAIYSDEV